MSRQHDNHCSRACPNSGVPDSGIRGSRTRLLVAGGVLASMMPLTAGQAAPALADDGAPAYGGFTATASSSPIRFEVFEPSIPIPVDAGIAQLEFSLGYSKVLADSSSSSGRASFFWPGDPVGEGLKTFAEQLGFPPSPFTDRYPVQANSQFPGDPASQKEEPLPGSIQRTTSSDKTAVAETGFSPDGEVLGPDAPEGGGGGAPANPLSGLTDQLQGLPSGGLPGAKTTAAPANPLALLADVDGYVSVSKLDASKGPVATSTRSTLGEIRLLGGLITMGGLETVARASTDGAKGATSGRTVYGKMAIAGQQFSIGPDGIESAGSTTAIPGLKDLPADALEQLGISITAPDKVRKVEGDAATSTSEGVQVTIDTKTLAPVLRALPAGVLAELVPAEAGPLRGLVAGLSNLSPRIVITLGVSRASVDTVPAIAPIPPGDAGGAPAAEPPATTGGGKPAAGSVGVAPDAGAPAPAGAAPTAPASDGAVGELVDAAPASAGLPKLFSIPGMLLLAAFAAAAVAGSWFRRIGAAALGGGAPCPHGLESGLPDLRKA